MDFIITVCDQAAGEACPYWPGQPMTVHWGMPDPAAVEGSEEEKLNAFRNTLATLNRRIELLLNLPLGTLDPASIKQALNDIGGH